MEETLLGRNYLSGGLFVLNIIQKISTNVIIFNQSRLGCISILSIKTLRNKINFDNKKLMIFLNVIHVKAKHAKNILTLLLTDEW